MLKSEPFRTIERVYGRIRVCLLQLIKLLIQSQTIELGLSFCYISFKNIMKVNALFEF